MRIFASYVLCRFDESILSFFFFVFDSAAGTVFTCCSEVEASFPSSCRGRSVGRSSPRCSFLQTALTPTRLSMAISPTRRRRCLHSERRFATERKPGETGAPLSTTASQSAVVATAATHVFRSPPAALSPSLPPLSPLCLTTVQRTMMKRCKSKMSGSKIAV